MNEKRTTTEQERKDENRDPITGTPGAHPVGTGVGAAGGGAAGAAIGTAVGGPIGAAVGLVAGAVIGGLAGKGAAEAIDPTAEDNYWRENYRNREYVTENTSYDTYRPAYRVSYEAYSLHRGKRYEEVEPELRREYGRSAGTSGLAWDKATRAARDAWEKLEHPASTGSATTSGKNNPSSSSGGGCGCS